MKKSKTILTIERWIKNNMFITIIFILLFLFILTLIQITSTPELKQIPDTLNFVVNNTSYTISYELYDTIKVIILCLSIGICFGWMFHGVGFRIIGNN